MGLPPGRTNNLSGKPKGTKNKAGRELREAVKIFLEGEFEQAIEHYNALQPKDKLKFFLDLLPYGLPKLQALDMNFSFEKLNDDQLDEIIDRIKYLNNGPEGEDRVSE